MTRGVVGKAGKSAFRPCDHFLPVDSFCFPSIDCALDIDFILDLSSSASSHTSKFINQKFLISKIIRAMSKDYRIGIIVFGDDTTSPASHRVLLPKTANNHCAFIAALDSFTYTAGNLENSDGALQSSVDGDAGEWRTASTINKLIVPILNEPPGGTNGVYDVGTDDVAAKDAAAEALAANIDIHVIYADLTPSASDPDNFPGDGQTVWTDVANDTTNGTLRTSTAQNLAIAIQDLLTDTDNVMFNCTFVGAEDQVDPPCCAILPCDICFSFQPRKANEPVVKIATYSEISNQWFAQLCGTDVWLKWRGPTFPDVAGDCYLDLYVDAVLVDSFNKCYSFEDPDTESSASSSESQTSVSSASSVSISESSASISESSASGVDLGVKCHDPAGSSTITTIDCGTGVLTFYLNPEAWLLPKPAELDESSASSSSASIGTSESSSGAGPAPQCELVEFCGEENCACPKLCFVYLTNAGVQYHGELHAAGNCDNPGGRYSSFKWEATLGPIHGSGTNHKFTVELGREAGTNNCTLTPKIDGVQPAGSGYAAKIVSDLTALDVCWSVPGENCFCIKCSKCGVCFGPCRCCGDPGMEFVGDLVVQSHSSDPGGPLPIFGSDNLTFGGTDGTEYFLHEACLWWGNSGSISTFWPIEVRIGCDGGRWIGYIKWDDAHAGFPTDWYKITVSGECTVCPDVTEFEVTASWLSPDVVDPATMELVLDDPVETWVWKGFSDCAQGCGFGI